MCKTYLWFAGMTILTSCVRVNLEDVSSDDKYSNLIGQEYRSVVELVVHGVTTDPNYGDEVDYYSLAAKPAGSGPEIIFKDLLAVDILIRIDKAMDCTNCFDSGIHFQVAILSTDKYSDHPVMVVDGVDMEFIEDDNGKARVNPHVFVEISD